MCIRDSLIAMAPVRSSTGSGLLKSNGEQRPKGIYLPFAAMRGRNRILSQKCQEILKHGLLVEYISDSGAGETIVSEDILAEQGLPRELFRHLIKPASRQIMFLTYTPKSQGSFYEKYHSDKFKVF